MDFITLVFLILAICGYLWFIFKICDFGELFNMNRFVTFILCLIFTPFLVYLVLTLIDRY